MLIYYKRSKKKNKNYNEISNLLYYIVIDGNHFVEIFKEYI